MASGTRDYLAGPGSDPGSQIGDLPGVVAAFARAYPAFPTGGVVVFSDNMEAGIVPYEVVTSGGGSVSNVNTQRFGSARSLQLTTNNISGYAIAVSRRFAKVTGRIGFEAKYRHTSGQTLMSVQIVTRLNRSSPGYSSAWRVLIVIDGGSISTGRRTLQIQEWNGSTNVTTNILTNAEIPHPDNIVWNTVKLVVDPVTDEYIAFYINDMRIDLTGHYAPRFTGLDANNGEFYQVYFYLVTSSAAAKTIYIDDLVFTRDEP